MRRGLLLLSSALGLLSENGVSAGSGFSTTVDNVGWEIRTTPSESKVELKSNSKIASWTAAGTGGIRLAQDLDAVQPVFSDHGLNFKNGSVLKLETPISLSAPGDTRFALALAFSAKRLTSRQTIFDSGNGVKVTIEPAGGVDPNVGRISFILPNNAAHTVETCVGRMSLFMFTVFVEGTEDASSTELKAAIYKNGVVLGSKGLPINEPTITQQTSQVLLGCPVAQAGVTAADCFEGKMSLAYILKENVDAKTAGAYYDVFKKNQLAAVLGSENCGNGQTEGDEECDGESGCTCACYKSCKALNTSELTSKRRWKFPNGANDFYPGAEVKVACVDETVATPGFLAEGIATCENGEFTLPQVKCEKPCGSLTSYLNTFYSARGVTPMSETKLQLTANDAAGNYAACRDGFMSTDGREYEAVTCSEGVWSDVTLDCRESCSAFEAVRHPLSYKTSASTGSARGGAFMHGEKLTITCAPGSSSTNQEVSSEVISCIRGQWTAHTLTCEPSCPTFPALAAGYKFADKKTVAASNQAGVVVGIQCDNEAGYFPTQSSIPADYTDKITCANGVWTAQTLLCKRGCEDYFVGETENMEKPVLHADVYTGSNDRLSNGAIPYGRALTLTCKDGFASSNGKREEVISCAGTWPERTLKCEPVCNSRPVIPAGLRLADESKTATDIQTGAIRRVLCEENTSSLSGRTEEYIHCSNGRWTIPTLTCLNNCPADAMAGLEFDPKRYEVIEDLGDKQFASFLARKAYMLPSHDQRGHHVGTASSFLQTKQVSATATATATATTTGGDAETLLVKTAIVVPETRALNSIGARRMLKCKDGFADPRDGRTFEFITCVDSKWSAPTLVCEPICEPFPELSSAYMVYSDGEVFHGASRIVSCSSGHRNILKNGFITEEVFCSFGKWGAISLDCHADCQDDDIPAYISVLSDKTAVQHGSVRELMCFEQRNRTDAVKVHTTCLNGRWSDYELNCNGDCPAYEDFSGKYKLDSEPCTTAGCSITLGCDHEKFSTVAQGLQTCDNEGTWTGTLPECKALCGAFPELSPAYKAEEVANGVVHVTCAGGYVQEPQGTDGILSTCSEGGATPGAWKFSLDSIKCLPTCSAYTPNPNEIVLGSDGRTQWINGETLNVACEGDITINAEVTCVAGEWSDSALTCRSTCDINRASTSLKDMVSGGVFSPAYRYLYAKGDSEHVFHGKSEDGDWAVVACSEGYIPVEGSGAQEIRCTDGVLTTPSLRCAAPCPSKSPLQCESNEVCRYRTKGMDVSPGSSRQVYCADGYYPSQGVSVEEIFCEDGKWTTPAITCSKQCGNFNLDTKTNVAASAVTINAKGVQTVKLSCAAGFSSPLGSSTSEEVLTCAHGAWPRQNLKCEPNCQGLPNIDASWNIEVFQSPSGVNAYEEMVVSCKGRFNDENTSFKPNNPSASELETLYCRNGKWSAPTLRCSDSCLEEDLRRRLQAHVDAFPGLVMPEIDMENYMHATVACPETADVIRGETPEALVCQNGEWSHVAIECAHACPALSTTDLDAFKAVFGVHSDADTSNYEVVDGGDHEAFHGETARVKCREGTYPAEGSDADEETITCIRGTWTKAALHCAPSCAEFVDETLVIGGSSDKKRRHGASRQISCAEGTRAVQGPIADSTRADSQSIMCKNGEWVGRTLECRANCAADALHSSTVEDKCPVGQSSTTGINAGLRVCVNGEYTSSAVDCRPDCPAFDPAVHAAGLALAVPSQAKRTSQGSVVEVSCPEGYSAIAGLKDGARTESLRCWNGQWTTPVIQCMKSCTAAPVVPEGVLAALSGDSQTATLSCDVGYVSQIDSKGGLSGTSKVICTDGTWSASPLKCQRALKQISAKAFRPVWSPQGDQPAELPGRLDAEFSVYRPTPEYVTDEAGVVREYFPLGDYLVPSGVKAVAATEAPLVSGNVLRPVSYELIWQSASKVPTTLISAVKRFANGEYLTSDKDIHTEVEKAGSLVNYISANGVSVSLWKPVAPLGYRCLGTVASRGSQAPSRDAIRCVPKMCTFKSSDETSLGTSAYGFSAWGTHKTLFIAAGETTEKDSIYLISRNCVDLKIQ